MARPAPASPEFSRVFHVTELSRPTRVTTTAKPDECLELAARFQLEGLAAFSVDWTIEPQQDDAVLLKGELVAHVQQICVVTLEAIESEIKETFEIMCLPEVALVALEQNEEVLFEEFPHDEPEPIVDGEIDLGELASQHLAMLIDPYPRKREAAIQPENASQGNFIKISADADETEIETKNRPFSALEQLKNRLK